MYRSKIVQSETNSVTTQFVARIHKIVQNLRASRDILVYFHCDIGYQRLIYAVSGTFVQVFERLLLGR